MATRGADLRNEVRRSGWAGAKTYAQNLSDQGIIGQADLYRNALEKAAYGGAGREFQQGLGQLNNFLAGAGPLADSGAATGLRARLLSDVYGRAQGRIQGGYADYLRQALQARQQYRYQQQLAKQAEKAQKGGGFWGTVGGIAGGVGGFLAGGPAGAAAGYGAGNQLGGGY